MTDHNAQGQGNTGGEGNQGGSGGDGDQGGTSFSADITQKCVEVTEKFRAGTITKISAILELQATIPRDDEATHHQALEAYIRVLDNFERIRDRVIPGGVPGGRDRSTEPHVGRVDGENEDEVVTGQSKRTWSESPGTDDGTTRRKINTDAFAWVVQDGIDPPALSPSLLQTQATLENFS
jgi:hypothetical protein